MYKYAIDKGFADRCAQMGVTDPNEVQQLMKIAFDTVTEAQKLVEEEVQKRAAHKQQFDMQKQAGLHKGEYQPVYFNPIFAPQNYGR